MMSSRFSPITGMRLKPLRSASDIACRSVLLRSMNTTSVRGTMTSRTIVSPSSKTEWIIARSPDSMTWLASARSTSSRSSASDENGPSLKPRPGVRMLPSTMSSWGSGPRTFVKTTTSPALARARPAGRGCRPIVRGPTPMTTNSTTSITPTVSRAASQASVEVAEHDLGDQHDGGDLAEHPQEQRGVDEAGRVLGDRQQPTGAASSVGRAAPRRGPSRPTPARRRRWRRPRRRRRGRRR